MSVLTFGVHVVEVVVDVTARPARGGVAPPRLVRTLEPGLVRARLARGFAAPRGAGRAGDRRPALPAAPAVGLPRVFCRMCS